MRKNPFGNNVYVPIEPRKYLEEMAVRASVSCGRTYSASRFVRYLIENFSEAALKKIAKESHNEKT